MKVIVTKPYDARKLGVPVGTVLDESEAPRYLIEREKDMQDSKVSPGLTTQLDRDVETARIMRERVAAGHPPF